MLETALECEVVVLPEETFAFVVRPVASGEAAEFIHGALARVAEFATAFGGAQGPPLVITSAPDEFGSRVVEAGWPVAATAVSDGAVEVRTLHATRALRHVHIGPYEKLGGGPYAELFAAAHERGLRLGSGPRERYLDDPGSGEESVTEIVWPLS